MTEERQLGEQPDTLGVHLGGASPGAVLRVGQHLGGVPVDRGGRALIPGQRRGPPR